MAAFMGELGTQMRGNEIQYNCCICIIGVSLSETLLVRCMAEVPVVPDVCMSVAFG